MVNLEELPDILIVNEVSRYLRVSNYIVTDVMKKSFTTVNTVNIGGNYEK